MIQRERRNPVEVQEEAYRLPYHWFPEEKLLWFEREEKQRMVFDFINKYGSDAIHRYLDIGCGDGRWTSDIVSYFKRNVEAVGIDLSGRAIGFAKLITPEIDFQCHKAELLPFEDSSFDLVTAIEVLEHIEDHGLQKAIQEIRRIIKLNGLLIVTVPSWNLPLTPHHFRHYSMKEISNLLTSNGFSMLAIKGQSSPLNQRMQKLRGCMNRFPEIWRLWTFSVREAMPERALGLLVAARPTLQ